MVPKLKSEWEIVPKNVFHGCTFKWHKIEPLKTDPDKEVQEYMIYYIVGNTYNIS
jgi:hypothetical protein